MESDGDIRNCSAEACRRAEAGLRGFQGAAPDVSVAVAAIWRRSPFLSFGPANAVYPLYSVSKPLIAALVVGIAREKDIPLVSAVGTVAGLQLPEWVPELSLENLLNHTSGLGDYGGLAEYHAAVKKQPAQPWTQQEMFRRVTELGPGFAPGKGFSYSNPGYALLVHWLARETGKDLSQLFRERIADRFGLTSAFVPATAQDLARCAPGYSTYFSGERRDIRPLYHPGWVYHGLVAATAMEAALVLDAVIPDLLNRKRESIPLLPFKVPHCAEPFYYHGLMGDRQRDSCGHNGGGPGYSISAFKAGDVTICVICNRDEVDAAAAVWQVFHDLDGD